MSLRLKLRATGFVVALALPVAGLIWLLGGFATAPTGNAVPTKPGSAVSITPAEVTVNGAELSPSPPHLDAPSEDRVYLLVHATVVSRAHLPLASGTLQSIVRWPAMKREQDKHQALNILRAAADGQALEVLPDARADALYSMPEASILSSVNPGLTQDVTYVWELPLEAEPPTRIDLEIRDHEFAEVTTLEQTDMWLPADPVAAIGVPIKRAEKPEAGS